MKFSKGHNSVKNVDGVMVIVLLGHVSWRYFKRFLSYSADTIFLVKFSKGHNSASYLCLGYSADKFFLW